MKKGFTLIELLIVVSIIGILVVLFFYVVKPTEIMKKVRDAERLGNIHKLEKLITIISAENQAKDNIFCQDNDSRPCEGDSVSNSSAIDGTGWVRVSLINSDSIIIPTLPVDRINNSIYKYSYKADDTSGKSDWELNINFESDEYKLVDDWDGKDGGDDPDIYEGGTNL